jgi:prepilin-type N-terminal cleavage/methylation domain-containing protein
MNTKIRNNMKGFTIIEVLIVLAIAGLIMVIVFLAVPSLQRNSRNTQIRNDAASVLGYINEFSSNNNGKLPTDICVDEDSGTVSLGKDGGACNIEAGKIRAGIPLSAGTAVPTVAQELVVGLNLKCNADNTAFGATLNRGVSIGYASENTTDTPDPQCVQS